MPQVLVLIAAVASTGLSADMISQMETSCRTSASLSFMGPEQTWRSNARERSLEDLQRWVSSQRIQSPTELVQSFRNAAQGEWPSSSVLSTASRSLQRQGIDRTNPRAIVYGSGLILAMTGHGGFNNSIEVAAFDRERNEYRFGLLDFNAQPPTLSEPVSCQRCHGHPPGLLWQPLHFWDLLTRVHQGEPFQRPNSIYSAIGNGSTDNWKDLLNFTAYIDHLTMRRMAEAIHRGRDAHRFRFATLAAVLGCPNIPGFLDAETARSLERATGGLTELRSQTLRVMRTNQSIDYQFAMQRFAHLRGQIVHPSFTISDTDEIASLRYLAGRGIPWERLSATFSPQSDDFGFGLLSSGPHRGLGMRELTCHLLGPLARETDRLQPLVERRQRGIYVDTTDAECALLRNLSANAFNNARFTPRERRSLTH